MALTGALALLGLRQRRQLRRGQRLRCRSRDRRLIRRSSQLLHRHAQRRGLHGSEERHRGGHQGYQTACSDATINYNATGSGAGIKQFTGKQVDFAGSDSALKTDEATAAKASCGSDAWNLPMVAGPIAIAYNVKGVSNLVLNAEVAANIFNGVVTTWNDSPSPH